MRHALAKDYRGVKKNDQPAIAIGIGGHELRVGIQADWRAGRGQGALPNPIEHPFLFFQAAGEIVVEG